MKRSGIRRKAPITPAPLTTGRRRKPSEFARIYGSKARVAWIKELGCVICGRLPCDNAHTVGGGVGYKASYEVIVPLCRPHHQAYDQHRLTMELRAFVQWCAPRIEALWQFRDAA